MRYITQKIIPLSDFYKAMKLLQDYIHITTIGEIAVRKSIQIEAHDFEDALQYFSAEQAGVDTIVTRDISDYYFSKLPIYTPSDFLKQLHVAAYRIAIAVPMVETCGSHVSHHGVSATPRTAYRIAIAVPMVETCGSHVSRRRMRRRCIGGDSHGVSAAGR